MIVCTFYDRCLWSHYVTNVNMEGAVQSGKRYHILLAGKFIEILFSYVSQISGGWDNNGTYNVLRKLYLEPFPGNSNELSVYNARNRTSQESETLDERIFRQ